LIRALTALSVTLLICLQLKSQTNVAIDKDSIKFELDLNTLPTLNLLVDTLRKPLVDTILEQDTLIDSLAISEKPKVVPKKKKKPRLSAKEIKDKKEKLRWEFAVNKQEKTAIENYLKSTSGTNKYLLKASKKLEEFKITGIDTILFEKRVNYTFEFKGTEDKIPKIESPNYKEIIVKEKNSSFIIINTSYNFIDSVSFSIDSSSWKNVSVLISNPALVPSNIVIEEENKSRFTPYAIYITLGLLFLWALSFLFKRKEVIETPLAYKAEVDKVKTIAIEKVDKRDSLSTSKFSPSVEKTYTVAMSEIWADSTIANVIFEKPFIEELQYFLFGPENQNKVESVELGGFILGSYHLNSAGLYELYCNKYVGIESEKEDLYKMGFGSKAWLALEEVMHDHKYKSQVLLGWFHTHPGHGVFLSKPDLNICNNIFPEPYQFAMVMDTILTSSNSRYDVGLFSKKSKGQMNNTKEKKKEYVQWQDVIQRVLSS